MDTSLIRATARATVDAAVRASDAKGTRYLGGTVVSSNQSYGNATTVGYGATVGVDLDGDPVGTNTPVVNVTGSALPIGTRVIVADAPSGTFIVGCSHQPGGRYLIDGTRLTASAGTISFVNIPQCFQSLELILHLQITTASPGPFRNGIQFNGDTGANYTEDIIYSLTGAAPAYFGATLQTTGRIGQSAGATAGQSGIVQVLLPNYNTTYYKTANVQCSCYDTAARVIESGGTFWHATAAITQIVLLPQSGSFASGSTAELYGVGVAL